MTATLASVAGMATAMRSPTGIICNAFTVKTSPRMMALGMDRSMPAVAMTKVVPTLTTVRMATFWASRVRLLTVPNLSGASAVKIAMSSSRKASVMNTWLATMVRQRGRGFTSAAVTSVVCSASSSAESVGLSCSVMPASPWRRSRSWRRSAARHRPHPCGTSRPGLPGA